MAGIVIHKDRDGYLKASLWDSKTALMNIPSMCLDNGKQKKVKEEDD